MSDTTYTAAPAGLTAHSAAERRQTILDLKAGRLRPTTINSGGDAPMSASIQQARVAVAMLARPLVGYSASLARGAGAYVGRSISVPTRAACCLAVVAQASQSNSSTSGPTSRLMLSSSASW